MEGRSVRRTRLFDCTLFGVAEVGSRLVSYGPPYAQCLITEGDVDIP